MTVSSTTTPMSDSPSVRCVECCAPSSSLYKEYYSTIKLTTCTNCNRNVDPYVERDLALVLLDCVLLRLPAYRHVLFNSDATASFNNRIPYYALFVASILQAALLWEAMQSSENDAMTETNTTIEQRLVFLKLLLYSGLGISVQISVTCIVLNRRHLYQQVALAILVPSVLVSIITLVILAVWERTNTIRYLGKVMQCMFQCTTLVALSDDNGGVCFLVGLVFRLAAASLLFFSLDHVLSHHCNSTNDIWHEYYHHECISLIL